MAAGKEYIARGRNDVSQEVAIVSDGIKSDLRNPKATELGVRAGRKGLRLGPEDPCVCVTISFETFVCLRPCH